MPNFDATGPSGKGPRTGRGLGPCGGGSARGFGRGGFGRGFCGCGYGIGWRRFYSADNQLDALRNEEEVLKKELDALREEREFLEKGSKEK